MPVSHDDAITAQALLDILEQRASRVKHAAIPDTDPPKALCGTRITGTPAGPAGAKCVVCLDLAARNHTAR